MQADSSWAWLYNLIQKQRIAICFCIQLLLHKTKGFVCRTLILVRSLRQFHDTVYDSNNHAQIQSIPCRPAEEATHYYGDESICLRTNYSYTKLNIRQLNASRDYTQKGPQLPIHTSPLYFLGLFSLFCSTH